MAKPKRTIHRFSAECSNVTIGAQLSNKTHISRSAGTMLCTCEVCSIQFYRKASEVKRHAHTYCGRACAGFACRRRVNQNCRMCGKLFIVIASQVNNITCCSDECKRKSHGVDAIKLINAGGNPMLFESHARKIALADIPKIVADTRTHKVIAADYGVTRAAISNIKRNH